MQRLKKTKQFIILLLTKMSFNQHTNRNQKRKSHMEQTKMSRYFNKKYKNAEVVDNHKEKDNSETLRTSDTDMATTSTTPTDEEKRDSALPNENISNKTTVSIDEISANVTACLSEVGILDSGATYKCLKLTAIIGQKVLCMFNLN